MGGIEGATMIQGPFPTPVRPLFGSTRDYKETLYLLPEGGPIPIGRDLAQYPLKAALYWLKGRIQLHVSVGIKDKTLEESRNADMCKFAVVDLPDSASTHDVWLLTRALCMVLLGAACEVSPVKEDPVTGMLSFPILTWMDADGRGTCPLCKMKLPWRPAFPLNQNRRCPSCHALMVHREGVLDVMKGSQ